MNRRRFIERIQDRLGHQKLIWVGTRGHDAIGLMDIPQFSEVYAIVAPLGSVSVSVDVALEQATKKRVDLDTYTIDRDRSPEAIEFRHRLLDTLNEPVAIAAYRSLALLSSISYPRSNFVTYLGMFHERQATFEHKPWVETQLQRAGVNVIPWRYFAREDSRRLEEELIAQRVLVLRANRSDGGAGLRAMEGDQEIPLQLSRYADGFLAAAPLLEPHIPLNASACIFRDGAITIHPPSMQLIGIEQCTRRRFGYCGNDFGAVRELEEDLVAAFAELIARTGRWLHSEGYIGAFGVDAMVYDGRVFLTEINPRFQGSSALCARIDREADRPDLYSCHIAAMLDLPSPPTRKLHEIVADQPDYAQIVVHNRTPGSIRMDPKKHGRTELASEIAPGYDIEILPDAIVYRAVAACRVTNDGRTLAPGITASLEDPNRPTLAMTAAASE